MLLKSYSFLVLCDSNFLTLQMERWCGSPGGCCPGLPSRETTQRGVLLADSPLLLHLQVTGVLQLSEIPPEATVSPDSSHPVMEQDGGTRAGPLLPDMGFLWSVVCALGLPVRLAAMCLRFFSSPSSLLPSPSQGSDLHLSLPTYSCSLLYPSYTFASIHLLHISFCLGICFSEDQN